MFEMLMEMIGVVWGFDHEDVWPREDRSYPERSCRSIGLRWFVTILLLLLAACSLAAYWLSRS